MKFICTFEEILREKNISNREIEDITGKYINTAKEIYAWAESVRRKKEWIMCLAVFCFSFSLSTCARLLIETDYILAGIIPFCACVLAAVLYIRFTILHNVLWCYYEEFECEGKKYIQSADRGLAGIETDEFLRVVDQLRNRSPHKIYSSLFSAD